MSFLIEASPVDEGEEHVEY